MRIKRFNAPDMRTALRMVREEQGADAVILSNRRSELGVEIVAATDYDEAQVQQALRAVTAPAPAAPASVTAPSRDAGDPTPTPSFAARLMAIQGRAAAATAAAPETCAAMHGLAPAAVLDPVRGRAEAAAPAAPPLSAVPAARAEATPWRTDPGLDEVRGELAAMREMIEREMTRLGDERLRGAPVRAQALDLLAEYGCELDLARVVAAQIPADMEPARAKGLMLGLLAKKLSIVQHDPVEDGGIVALIGPTGAGKTTTLAKLAARYAARHGARDVALVTTDTLRVGGREQLSAYGRLLGMAVFEADSEQALAVLLERLSDYGLVLVDTAGLSQRDRALMTRLAWLRDTHRVRSLLVLPANAHPADLDENVRRFRDVAPDAAVLSKVDETGRLGAALSVLVRHGLPLAFVADGQRVPEDLHRAEAHRIVLRLDALRRAADTYTQAESAHGVA